jgi:hypothetical protein
MKSHFHNNSYKVTYNSKELWGKSNNKQILMFSHGGEGRNYTEQLFFKTQYNIRYNMWLLFFLN